MDLPTLARRVAPALAASTALTAAGCGTTTIDAGKGEKLIRTAVTDQVGARVKTVTCPEGRESKKGDVFSCEVVGTDGSKGGVKVTQKDDKGNVKINAPFLHVREAESAIVTGIKQQIQVDAKVRCPEIVPVAAGASFTCKASSAGQTRPVAVKQTDARGHFTYKLA